MMTKNEFFYFIGISSRPLRQTASWDSQVGNPVTCAPTPPPTTTVIIPAHGDRRRSSRHLSSEASGAERDEDEVCWSSDYSNSDEEDSNQDPFPAENTEVDILFFLDNVSLFL